MKRKIISLAKSTNVVTLPIKWCDENQLQKGDEVAVSENGDSVVISPIAINKKIVLDITGLNKVIRRILGACYKSGYDEMIIKYSSNEGLRIAEDVIEQEFIGFEITSIDKEEKRISAKIVTELSIQDFESMLRRLIRFLFDIAKEIKNNFDNKNELLRISQRDKEVNKIADYCRRIINKNSLLEITKKYRRNPPLYYIIEQLEKIGDDLRDLSIMLTDQLNKESLKILLSLIVDYYESFYNLFYSFNFQDYSNFCTKKKEILIEIENTNIRTKDYIIINHFTNITNKIFDLNGAIVAINI